MIHRQIIFPRQVKIRVLHGSGNGKIQQDYHRKTVRTIISTRLITIVTTGLCTVHAVILWEWQGMNFSCLSVKHCDIADGLLFMHKLKNKPNIPLTNTLSMYYNHSSILIT